ncbi:melanoma-associated antigen B4-like [Echinops telfairi]|uniref:Melanoma-associated antigen B4-like n=1 Tax=Echinops telfairi TaxID=9371 RepID=A0AC55D4N3_ECHTE|nr:melanoma-associated antigen B4-like [Echinops telfairi]
MPRGQKSKRRAREKRQQARGQSQAAQGAQATAMEEEGPSSSSSVLEDTPQRSSVEGVLQESKEATAPASNALSKISDVDAKGQDQKSPSLAQDLCSTEKPKRDLSRKIRMLLLFLVDKYNMKEPLMKADMLKVVNKKFQKHFPEILSEVAERMKLFFGLELREAKSRCNAYELIKTGDVTKRSSLNGGLQLPMTSLLITVLGVIFVNGNRASEESIWKFLNMLGIYAGRMHNIFGEPRKLLVCDFVLARYLQYQQVRKSRPPRYEFLWGPRACAETTKMKVLEFWAMLKGVNPWDFPGPYEEALRDEQMRARRLVASIFGSTAYTTKSSGPSLVASPESSEVGEDSSQ